ncbi:CBU_0592 family membrane protein [Cognatilysobacter bugurensis]|uniref:CBU-0592-like domain-containing protein n=1 Tax=Cognatilysobacter bugurensis TaxID=543356 RepID=A0A918W883_9GAMM|nr:hypothetical protein [Lysobacter bugurensis]GHA75274.1 hypothetical protein GCM10007067_10480 [Lysobacter bugurensis]
MNLAWYDVIGLLGTLLILAAYFLLQVRRIDGNGVLYPTLNLFGAAGILVSLLGTFNLSVFLLEAAWILVSAYGIWQGLKSRRETRDRA